MTIYSIECAIRQNDYWVIVTKNQQVTVDIVENVPTTLSKWSQMVDGFKQYHGKIATITKCSFGKQDQSFLLTLTIKDEEKRVPSFWVKADNDYKYNNGETFVYTGELHQCDGVDDNIGSQSDSESADIDFIDNDIGNTIMEFDAAFSMQRWFIDNCNVITCLDGDNNQNGEEESNANVNIDNQNVSSIEDNNDDDNVDVSDDDISQVQHYREYGVDKNLIAPELIQPVKHLMALTDKAMMQHKNEIIQQCDQIKNIIENDDLITDITTEDKETINRMSKRQHAFDITGVSLQVKKI